jgi:GT2 family glycosyltransferase
MSPPDPFAVDAVIVTWNSGPDLADCLAALPPTTRAIVVDNGSDDDAVKVARSFSADVIELGENRGFPAAVNIGLGHVTSDVTLLLNPDVVVAQGAIEHCREVLESEPSIGLVGPNTVMIDGRPEPPAARRDRRAVYVLLESLGLTHIHPWFDRQTIRGRDVDRDVDAVNGAFMLVRTDLLRSLGGLDETVFMYFEDGDLCRRVRDAGFRVRFVAGASAVHGAATSTRRADPSAQARAYLHRLDADIEFLRRYGRRGEAGVAVAAFLLRASIGLAVSIWKPERRVRYVQAFRWTLKQRKARRPPPAV